jgi:anti-sigma B factor antagonist
MTMPISPEEEPTSHERLEISDVPVDAERHVLRVVGELDLFGVPDLKRRLTELIERDVRCVAVDLSGVSFLDSTALGAILGGMRRLRARGGELAIVNLSPSISQLLQITGLDQMIAITPTLEEALALLADSRSSGNRQS